MCLKRALVAIFRKFATLSVTAARQFESQIAGQLTWTLRYVLITLSLKEFFKNYEKFQFYFI